MTNTIIALGAKENPVSVSVFDPSFAPGRITRDRLLGLTGQFDEWLDDNSQLWHEPIEGFDEWVRDVRDWLSDQEWELSQR